MPHLAQELWDEIVRDLPSFSVRSAAQAFGFKLPNEADIAEDIARIFICS